MNWQVVYGLWAVCVWWRPLFRPKLTWEGEMGLKETGWEIVCWVYVTSSRLLRKNVALSIQVPSGAYSLVNS